MDKSIEKLKKERRKIGMRVEDLTIRLCNDSQPYDEMYKICKKIITLLEKRKILDKIIKTADRQK